MLRSIVLPLLVLVLGACAGINQYATGVPARDADRFMVSMELAAQHRGHRSWRSNESMQLNVEVERLGTLLYAINESQVVMTTHPDRDGGESEIEGRSAALKVEHDELMRIAREEAWNNKAFTD